LKVVKLIRQQNGKCPICRSEIMREQISASQVHIHHLLPQSVSEDDKLTNLRLIHSDCHRELHRILKIEEMERLAKEGFDYCNHKYLYHNSSNDLESVVR
jgi:CRISPR/Cas system Type II protein with McrA/HNH and RuvC-like nuclease domain